MNFRRFSRFWRYSFLRQKVVCAKIFDFSGSDWDLKILYCAFKQTSLFIQDFFAHFLNCFRLGMFTVLSIIHNIGSNDFWEYWTASFSNILRHAPKLFTSSHSEGGRGEKTIFVFIFTSFSLIHISIKLYNLSSCIELISSCTLYTLHLSLNWYGDIARYTLCFCISRWQDLHKRAAMCPTETYSEYFFHLKN